MIDVQDSGVVGGNSLLINVLIHTIVINVIQSKQCFLDVART